MAKANKEIYDISESLFDGVLYSISPISIEMTDLKSQINLEKLPQHVAIIMDGNGRWAKEQGKNRVWGHREGVRTVREITEAAAELGVKYLTL